MILRRYLIAALGLELKLSECVIIVDSGRFEGCRAPMVELGTYNYNSLDIDVITP